MSAKPRVPTVHASTGDILNYKDEAGNMIDNWFGGGTDLTPYYILKEDGKHFIKH